MKFSSQESEQRSAQSLQRDHFEPSMTQNKRSYVQASGWFRYDERGEGLILSMDSGNVRRGGYAVIFYREQQHLCVSCAYLVRILSIESGSVSASKAINSLRGAKSKRSLNERATYESDGRVARP